MMVGASDVVQIVIPLPLSAIQQTVEMRAKQQQIGARISRANGTRSSGLGGADWAAHLRRYTSAFAVLGARSSTPGPTLTAMA